MSRKDRKSLLEGLMTAPAAEGPGDGRGDGSGEAGGEKLTAVNSGPVPHPAPHPARPRGGAVGAISSAVTALRANGVLELDPATIHAGGLEDRLEDLPEDDAALRRSIADHGQQVPVLVRPHPGLPGEWQVVYGRRRVLAARDLGIRVKALARDLDDAALVMAQGQENSLRRDLSFIEKASFAGRMQEAGYGRAVICDALAVDKTALSRMLSLVERLPRPLIEAIGPAHGVGRPRWLDFAEMLEELWRAGALDLAGLAAEIPLAAAARAARAEAASSDARFEAALALLRDARRRLRSKAASARVVPGDPPLEIRAADGLRLATARRSARGTTLSLAPAGGFEDWLLARLPALHAAWREQRREAGETGPEGAAEDSAEDGPAGDIASKS